jgi:hypothetical protein
MNPGKSTMYSDCSTTSTKSSLTVRSATIRYKLLYTVLIMKCKVLHYFKSHLIRVVTSFGLREIVRNRLATERIAKWALELLGLDITYVPQMAIKSQALTDFVAEWTET